MSTIAAHITDQERAARAFGVENALASVRLEGLEPSEGAKAIFERYVAGELTLDEMDEEIRALNAREFGPLHLSGD
jgi:hypothetical protein